MKQLILLFSLFVLGVTNVYSQEKQDPKYVREANFAFNSGNYFEAIPKCEDAFKKLGVKGSLKQKGDMAYKVAESYRNMERYEKANEWYGVCLELRYFDIKPEVYYHKANMQRMLKDFTGVNMAYEVPLAPGCRVDTSCLGVDACIDAIMVRVTDALVW